MGLEGQITSIPLSKLETNPWNCNVMPSPQMKSLLNTLAKEGPSKVQPIVVRPVSEGKMQIVDGEHRYLAAKELGWESIPSIVIDMDDEKAKVMCITLNYLRGRLDPIRLFEVLYKDWEGGEGSLSTRQLEQMYHHIFDQSWIVRILQLRRLSQEVREELKRVFSDDRETSIGLKHLLAIAQLESGSEQMEFLKALLATGVSVTTLERMIREYKMAKQKGIVDGTKTLTNTFESKAKARAVNQATESIFKCEACSLTYRVNWRRRSVSKVLEEEGNFRAVYVQLQDV